MSASDLRPGPALLLVGHGSRSGAGVEGYWRFAEALGRAAQGVRVACGFIELAEPDLATAIDDLVAGGADDIVAVPLVLLGAGHLKDDGPLALAAGRRRHPGVSFGYARDLGVHPAPVGVARDRLAEALGQWPVGGTGVVVVSRGSSDPDANSDLFKVSRLLWDGSGLDSVEAAFVSLAPPSVPDALDRLRRLGAERIVVVPYFLFTGVLVERIAEQAAVWAQANAHVPVRVAGEMGHDPRLIELVLERYREAVAGDTRMNCDGCAYRVALPGYGDRVGRPPGHGHHH